MHIWFFFWFIKAAQSRAERTNSPGTRSHNTDNKDQGDKGELGSSAFAQKDAGSELSPRGATHKHAVHSFQTDPGLASLIQLEVWLSVSITKLQMDSVGRVCVHSKPTSFFFSLFSVSFYKSKLIERHTICSTNIVHNTRSAKV